MINFLEDYQWSNIIILTILVLAFSGLYFVLSHHFWGRKLRPFLKNKYAVTTLVIVALYLVIALLDGLAWKDDIDSTNKKAVPLEAQLPRTALDRLFAFAISMPEYEYREKSYSAPLAKTDFLDSNIKLKFRHILGTTQNGYDTFYQLLKGFYPSITIGVLPLLVIIPLALLFGILAGYFGGRIDDVIVYIYSTLSSIPGILLLIALITVLGQGLINVAIGLGVTGWVGLCRLVRGETFKLREMEYIEAARGLGIPTWKIILSHILPNLTHIIIIVGILTFSGLVLAESILAYLGIGLKHSWGAMIDSSRSELAQDPLIWWNIAGAFTALFGLVFSVNILGDSLRDVLDPKTNND